MFSPHASNTDALIEAISQMPAEWALTLCIGKQNFWKDWNKAKLDRQQLIAAIRSQTNAEGKKCTWTGVSLVTGSLSGGIMAVDFDGPLALEKYRELSGGSLYPTTKRWTSGKHGHFQILLSVPRSRWENLAATKFFILNPAPRLELGLSVEVIAQQLNAAVENSKITAENIQQWESGTTSPIPPAISKKLTEFYGCNNSELCQKLELRWNECSTLPPSIHPDTGKPYVWKNTGEIAEAPQFILDLMREAPAVELPKIPTEKSTIYIDVEKSLVDILENEILPRLDAEEFYGNWVALKKSGDSLKGLCPFHQEKTGSFSVSPAEKLFKCFGCGVGGGPVQFLHQIKGGTGSPTGKDFYEVVMELADRTGVQMPDRQQRQTQNLKSNTQKSSNVLTHPKFETPDAATLETEIEKLFSLDLKRSQIQLKISELAKTYRLPSSDIWKIYREQEQEKEQEADRPDVATEIESLLSAHKTSIKLTEVLPVGLAQPIEKLAGMLNLRSECYLAALLAQVSSLYKVGTETILRRDTDWRCVPNYNCGMVGESSQLKSPVPRAMILRPMRELRERDQRDFEQAKLNYETELNNWKAAKKEDDRGPKPKEPKLRVRIFDKTTGEAIIYQQAEFPDQAMMFCCDELAGMLKSANQYRGGKGSDEEDMLSFWNGTGTTVLRASGVRASVEAVGLSVFGTIQPDVLAGLLKDCSDSNGKFARFDFVFQPLAVPNLPEDDGGRFDLTPMLSDLYQRIDNLPAICFEFDKQAKEYHRVFTLACHRRRIAEPKQGLRAAFGKMPEKVGKLATIIHGLTCVFNGQQVTNQIPRSAVESAVKFVKFAADQVASLYTEFSDRSALAPNLTKILLAAERQGGKISVRDAQKAFNFKFRPTAQVTKSWFNELVALGYGAIKTSGKSIFFENTRGTVPPIPQLPSNSVPVMGTGTDLTAPSVGQFPQLENFTGGTVTQMSPGLPPVKPLQDKGSRSIGVTVTDFAISKKLPTDENVKTENFDTESVQNFQKWAEQISENYKNLSELQNENLEAVTVPPMAAQSQPALTFDPVQIVGQMVAVGDSSPSGLNEDETELLEYLQKAVAENDAYFAQQVRGILAEVCKSGAADRKKVWGALGDAEQKTFTELLAVEIPAEVGYVLEAFLQILGSSDDPNEIDHLYRVFSAELIDQAVELLRPADKSTILHWIKIRKLAAELIEACYDGTVADVAKLHSADLVTLAIARLEFLKELDAVDEIRDALS
ncbi:MULTISPECIES: DUF3987 domain-containing protein [unclassified Microcoleus]|uniref:DUF3987 domain-containing protein n=1 Tax=unclassified Microcoleus TaxID=2642155 RepID=UPI002FD039BC